MRIKPRNIVRDENGVIISGSAAIVENTYKRNANGDSTKNHTQQTVIERLGKVVWMPENDNSQGIFNTPERGLVFYDVTTDVYSPVSLSDPRLAGTKFQKEPERIHTNFGKPYLFFSELAKTPFMNVLRATFTDRVMFEKVLAHLAHDCLKNGASIKCGEFLTGSALSYLLTDLSTSTLNCDSSFYAAMSDDNLKTAYFRNLLKEMQKTTPDFGHACYVDSTPLPGEAENNPFNALCSHGTDGAVIQSRLVLVLDIQTNIPLWFEVIPSNVLDKSTILSIADDVKTTLGIDIDMYDLDAGYARQELFEIFNRNTNEPKDGEDVVQERYLLVRMPAAKGYPRDKLYTQCKPHFYSGKYSFDYEHHTFFGERVEFDLFGYPEYAHVFIDKTQAESLLRNWREQHQEEWNELTESAQDWYQVKDGFFILIGNKDQSPKEALIEYRSRAEIESCFRDGKSYLGILPISKWSKRTVLGKIFQDIIETTIYRTFRKQVSGAGVSMSTLLVTLDSWECFIKSDSLLELKTPTIQVRELFEKLGYAVTGHFNLEEFRREVFDGVPMSREPVTQRTRRPSNKETPPISPEEQIAAREQAQKARKEAEAKKRQTRAEAKADREYKRTKEKAADKKQRQIDRAKTRLKKVLQSAKRETTRTKAIAAYKQKVADAKEEYNCAVAEAKAVRDQMKAEAQAVYVAETTV